MAQQSLVLDNWEELVGNLVTINERDGEVEIRFWEGTLSLPVEKTLFLDEVGEGDRAAVLRTDDSLEETYRVRLDA